MNLSHVLEICDSAHMQNTQNALRHAECWLFTAESKKSIKCEQKSSKFEQKTSKFDQKSSRFMQNLLNWSRNLANLRRICEIWAENAQNLKKICRPPWTNSSVSLLVENSFILSYIESDLGQINTMLHNATTCLLLLHVSCNLHYLDRIQFQILVHVTCFRHGIHICAVFWCTCTIRTVMGWGNRASFIDLIQASWCFILSYIVRPRSDKHNALQCHYLPIILNVSTLYKSNEPPSYGSSFMKIYLTRFINFIWMEVSYIFYLSYDTIGRASSEWFLNYGQFIA
jgi:hypothetical protein